MPEDSLEDLSELSDSLLDALVPPEEEPSTED
jgi:hypothetical protein